MWVLMAKGVIPVGALVLLLLLSGSQFLARIAKMFLNSPLRIHNAQISLAMFMIGLCLVLAILSYACWQRAEHLANAQSVFLEHKLWRNVFLHSRNYWMSLLGLSVWGSAWRLQAFTGAMPRSGHERQPRQPVKGRIVHGIVLLVLACLADIPMCRLNYSMQLASNITPKKAEWLEYSREHGCGNAYLNSAVDRCAELCAETRKLSDERLETIRWARNWHVFGRLAAAAFDDLRNVEQGQGRIEKLFSERSCERVLQSIDKSNQLVNFFCGFLTMSAVMACVVCFQNMLDTPPVCEPAQGFVAQPVPTARRDKTAMD